MGLTQIEILVAVGCIAGALTAVALRKHHLERARFAVKIAASFLFLFLGLWSAAQRVEPLGFRSFLLLMALGMGFVGDVILGLLLFVPHGQRNQLFVLGGTFFFFGHVLYIIALLHGQPLQPWLLVLVALVPVALFVLHERTFLEPGKLLLPLLVYGVALGGMLCATLNFALQGGAAGRWMLLPGILFTLSDIALFLNRFGGERLKARKGLLATFVMLAYYLAQLLFALAIRVI